MVHILLLLLHFRMSKDLAPVLRYVTVALVGHAALQRPIRAQPEARRPHNRIQVRAHHR